MGKHNKTNDNNITKKTEEEKILKKKKKNKKKKKHIILKMLLILVILIVLFGIFIAKRIYELNGNWLAAILGHDSETIETLDKLQVLILGESTGMSDTIIIASYDPKTQEASLMSIPRDTFTGDSKLSAQYYHKINALYNYGETPEKTVEAVNEITGLNIQYYVIVDTEALIKLVDTIGGLEFDVPIDMEYDDNSQDLHINLSAGYQTLTGEQVEQLVRFRHNNDGTTYDYEYGLEDHGRSKTQRNVLIALAEQTLKFKNVTEISTIIDILEEYVDTNLDFNTIKNYIPYAIEMDINNIKLGSLPGVDEKVNGVWFFFHDEEETEILVNELFFGITEEVVEDIEESNKTNTVQ